MNPQHRLLFDSEIFESGGCSPSDCLTDEQRRRIRQAAQEAYDDLRWSVGDSREMMSKLQLLARDSFLAGMRYLAGECICIKCGLRQDAETPKADF